MPLLLGQAIRVNASKRTNERGLAVVDVTSRSNDDRLHQRSHAGGSFVEGNASPSLMVGDRLDWSVRCQRCLQQGYELGVEFRFNSAKVEQDIVLGYATDHRWIKPPQRLQ